MSAETPARTEGGSRWPNVSGHYIVGNPDRGGAICTPASSDLVDEIGPRDEVAIVGRPYTRKRPATP